MTFEEFFKKKKISLQLLQGAEPALFSEFKLHYEQMGEKSFDHTKKYWFNQLRRKFPAPPEVKAEKVVIENPIAEQTIADTLTEPAAPNLNVGFKPRFKAAMVNKPVSEEAHVPESPVIENKSAEDTATSPALGFKPKFRAANPPKPVEENKPATENAENGKEQSKEEVKPALGFTPKFKSAAKPLAPAEEKPAPEEKKEESASEQATEARPKLGFRPRFNPKQKEE